jgi:hygromycin-B 7''-O-kinase
MAKDFYLRPDAPDPILSAETVLSIVHRHVHDAKTVTSIDEGGGEARTYGIDATLILKIQRPHRARARTSLVRSVFYSKPWQRLTASAFLESSEAGFSNPTFPTL